MTITLEGTLLGELYINNRVFPLLYLLEALMIFGDKMVLAGALWLGWLWNVILKICSPLQPVDKMNAYDKVFYFYFKDLFTCHTRKLVILCINTLEWSFLGEIKIDSNPQYYCVYYPIYHQFTLIGQDKWSAHFISMHFLSIW